MGQGVEPLSAVRIYSGLPDIEEELTTINPWDETVPYELLSLPFYMVSSIPRLLEDFD